MKKRVPGDHKGGHKNVNYFLKDFQWYWPTITGMIQIILFIPGHKKPGWISCSQSIKKKYKHTIPQNFTVLMEV